jgi:hypothetical protein
LRKGGTARDDVGQRLPMVSETGEVVGGSSKKGYILLKLLHRIIDGKSIAHVIKLILVNFTCSCNLL